MFKLKKGNKILVSYCNKPIGITGIKRITKNLAITTNNYKFKIKQSNKDDLQVIKDGDKYISLYNYKLIDNDEDYQKYSNEILKYIYFDHIKKLLNNTTIIQDIDYKDAEKMFKFMAKYLKKEENKNN